MILHIPTRANEVHSLEDTLVNRVLTNSMLIYRVVSS
jgi:hypothetical protein